LQKISSALRNKTFVWEEAVFEKLRQVTEDGYRYYQTPEGDRYPSVTTVLSSLTKDSILAWRKKVGEEEANKIASKAARRGTKLHTLCEDYLHNKDDFADSHMPSTVSMFKAIQPHIDTRVEIVYGSEIPLYSRYLKVAGTCDLYCQMDGVRTVLDFKTSSKRKERSWIEGYFLQAATYALMIQERTGQEILQTAVLIAVEDDSPQLFTCHGPELVEWKKKAIKVFKDYHKGT